MRVLVTGGSGVIGEGLIPELLEGGHQIRLLSRHAKESKREWPAAVESFEADVANPGQLHGATDGCQAVIHISGIVDETPPDITFESVNVGGTRNLLKEASSAAAAPKFIFISSLAAERGASAYHKSKSAAEDLVRDYHGPWMIVRPGNVYGPGDEVISKLLTMHRTLPAIPMIGDGAHPFQPIWYIDLGKALRHAIEGDVVSGIYEVAGDEVTTADNLLDRLEKLTGRSPLRIPVPEFIAGLAVRTAQAVGLPFPINESQFQMILEQSVVAPGSINALSLVFHVKATPLADGLRILADVQPEQEPQEGVGKLERKRFVADIKNSRLTAEQLMAHFREHCTELMPIDFDVEPGASREVVKGSTLTANVAMRGNIQIRVEELTPLVVTFATLRGHPLAGVVRFSTSGSPAATVQFEVAIFVRAATVFDWVALNAGGQLAQNWTWRTVVERVVEISGGSADVREEQEIVSDSEGERIEDWIRDLITARKQDERKGAQEWKRGGAGPRE